MDLADYILEFKILKLIFRLRASDTKDLCLNLNDYSGGTLRGIFGIALKQSCCCRPQNKCQSCSLNKSCCYSYIFETPIARDSVLMTKYSNAPHPFIIETFQIPERRNSKNNSVIEFSITLFGKAISLYKEIIVAVKLMCENGLGSTKKIFSLDSVRCADINGRQFLFYDAAFDAYLTKPEYITINDSFSNNKFGRLKIKFLTPMRIQYNETIASRVEAHVLTRNLLRRIAHIYYFHVGGKKMDIDYGHYIREAEKISIVTDNLDQIQINRFSSRQNCRITSEGLIGETVYNGDFGHLLPILKLGEYINAGKGTAQGFGKYNLCFMENENE